MTTLRRTLMTVLALVSVAAVAAVMVLKKERDGAISTAPQVATAIEFAPTDLARVKVSDIAHTLPLTGTLNPVNWAYVKSRLAGDVREVRVREGEAVKKSQVLARI